MKNHPLIGQIVTLIDDYRIVSGTVIGVRRGNPLMDIHTDILTNNTIQVRIKPQNGGPAFWTKSVRGAQ